MKAIILNPTLQKVIVCLLVVLLFVVLFWPSPFVSDELLSQIKPGMSVEAATSILGKSYSGEFHIWGPPSHGPDSKWKWESRSLRMMAILPDEATPPPLTKEYQFNFWISDKQHLLWVQSKDGVIANVWSIPLKSTVH
ncbi:MAG: hypothetical protein QM703_17380 [Gemmatales bacterium]